jgi:hypothetical protein
VIPSPDGVLFISNPFSGQRSYARRSPPKETKSSEVAIFVPYQLFLRKVFFGVDVKIRSRLVIAILLIFPLAIAQETAGSVCVAARVDDPFWKEPTTLPNGEINSHGLRVKIDKRPAVAWPDRTSLKLDGLDTKEPHVLVVLSADGKPIESVRFKFSQYQSTQLCMAYDGYQGIGLQEVTRRTPWCKCH